MRTSTPFTFGIPLIPASLAADWDLVQDLLGLTLASVLAQTDPDFRVVVAGHDLPSRLPDDPRVTFVRAGWPAVDEALLVEDTVTAVVQVKGKVRDTLEVPADITAEDLEARARASQKVRNFIGDAEIVKVIVREPKLVNLVIR